jgi:hypothetical protein
MKISRVPDAPLAQWIRADDYGSSGRGFKSLMAHHPTSVKPDSLALV